MLELCVRILPCCVWFGNRVRFSLSAGWENQSSGCFPFRIIHKGEIQRNFHLEINIGNGLDCENNSHCFVTSHAHRKQHIITTFTTTIEWTPNSKFIIDSNAIIIALINAIRKMCKNFIEQKPHATSVVSYLTSENSSVATPTNLTDLVITNVNGNHWLLVMALPNIFWQCSHYSAHRDKIEWCKKKIVWNFYSDFYHPLALWW